MSDLHSQHSISHQNCKMADKNYAFYIHGAEEQMCSGYLYKSPPENQFKTQFQTCMRFFVLLNTKEDIWKNFSNQTDLVPHLLPYRTKKYIKVWSYLRKSWKRRFFVLLKYSNNTCQLKYYKNEEMNKPLGDIDLSKITFMFLNPEMHKMWNWIHNNFRCSPSCVMFIKVPDRDYFLVGENSWEMEKWFTALYDILNNRPHRLLDPTIFGLKRHIRQLPQPENDEQKAEWGHSKYVTHELPSPLTHEPIYASPSKFKSNQN